MKLDLINKYADQLKKQIGSGKRLNDLIKWECLSHFQNNWDVEELDFARMFDRCFTHPRSGYMWGGEKNSQKSFIMDIASLDCEFTRSMFKDLFNEDLDVLLRLDRFTFHCDQMLEILSSKDRRYNYHYHDNYKNISLYLSFRYPEKYCWFDFDLFSQSAENLEVKNKPQEFEILRFFKISQSLTKVLLRDEELLNIYKSYLENLEIQLPSQMMIHDFYEIVGHES